MPPTLAPPDIPPIPKVQTQNDNQYAAPTPAPTPAPATNSGNGTKRAPPNAATYVPTVTIPSRQIVVYPLSCIL